jgi:septum formation protein
MIVSSPRAVKIICKIRAFNLSSRRTPEPGARGPAPRLVLASSSRYRRELLGRLGVAFEVDVPDVDEQALGGELPAVTAERLSRLKARAVAQRQGESAIVIGSDQVAECGGRVLGKPGGREAAIAQLQWMNGRIARFHTGVCVVNGSAGTEAARVVTVDVRFRALSFTEIEAYVDREQPYDCTGSARIEGLGIVLVDRVVSDDPTALIGLPLIALSAMLRREGLNPLQ